MDKLHEIPVGSRQDSQEVPMPTVVIYVHGGLVQWAATTEPIEIIILDGDVDGAEDERLTNITFKDGDVSPVCVGDPGWFVDPAYIERIKGEIKEQEE